MNKNQFDGAVDHLLSHLPSNLINLKLSDNRLTLSQSLNFLTFSSLQFVKLIDIANNSLLINTKTLIFDGLPKSVQEIDLRDNRMHNGL